jgi:chromosome segregation ATPase
MKKSKLEKIILFIIMDILIISNSFSQKEYPRIEVDSSGKKLVVMTYEQAQKVDNTFELVKLLEKAGTECDSLTLSYIKVIDKLEKNITVLEDDIKLNKDQIISKDDQIGNLQNRLKNCEENSSSCDEQITTRDGQIKLLKDEITTLKTKRNVAYGAGILGIIGGILIIILAN